MKRLLPLALALVLSGCAALSPAAPAPQVVYQTVVVTVLVPHVITATPGDTALPTLTPIPTFTPLALIPPSGTAADTTATASMPTSALPSATLPPDAGGTLFTDLNRSTEMFGYNCQPDAITFGVTATDPKVAGVDFFYRLEDQVTQAVGGWADAGKMTAGSNGSYTFDFRSVIITRSLRGHKAWLDYQFVAVGDTGKVLGRSGRIAQQVIFSPDCSG